VNTPLRRSGRAHVLKGSHSFTCTPVDTLMLKAIAEANDICDDGKVNKPLS